MDKNKKILSISLLLIILSAAATVIVMNMMKIKKPVFLESYRDFGVYENEGVYAINEGFLELKYISNIDDRRTVTSITFKELPNAYFFASECGTYPNSISHSGYDANIDKYGRYAVHTVCLSCNDLVEGTEWEDVILENAVVEFNDGLIMDVDLGKIALYKEKLKPIALEGISYSGTSDGISSISTMAFNLKEDIKIEKIGSLLLEDSLGVYEYKVADLEYMDAVKTGYKKGSPLILTSYFNQPDDIIKKYTIYDIRPEIHFINSYNDRYSIRFNNMNYDNINFSGYGIYKYLKMMGAL